MSETRTQKQVRLVLEQQCVELAKLLKSKVPAGVGFILFLADIGEEGNIAYVSTVERQSAFKLLHEWLDHQDANHPAEGWEAAAMFVTELAEVLGCEPDPAEVLARCRALHGEQGECPKKPPSEKLPGHHWIAHMDSSDRWAIFKCAHCGAVRYSDV
jgi:hypothetical protein